MRGAQRSRSRTNHLCLSPKRDLSQIPFLLGLCLFCLSRHSVVTPTLAAPLLIDICRSTVGQGAREDIVTKPDEMERGRMRVGTRSCTSCSRHVLYVYRLLAQVDVNEFQTNELCWVRFNMACPPVWRYSVRILECALPSVLSNF